MQEQESSRKHLNFLSNFPTAITIEEMFLFFQQNGTVFNGTSSKAPPKNSDKKSGKEGNDNNKKVSSMLGVFLEGLTNGKDSSQTGKNKKQKNENKKQQQEAAAGKAALTAAS